MEIYSNKNGLTKMYDLLRKKQRSCREKKNFVYFFLFFLTTHVIFALNCAQPIPVFRTIYYLLNLQKYRRKYVYTYWLCPAVSRIRLSDLSLSAIRTARKTRKPG